jgi:hypothetical protein
VGGRLNSEERVRLEQQACYAVRVAMPMDCVGLAEDGRVQVLTPPDPRAGQMERLLDPLDWIRAVVSQIPDAGQHQMRYYGA